MNLKLLVVGIMLLGTTAAQASDCVLKYQNRIDQAETWGRLTYKWPAQIRKRQAQAQEMINLINQSKEALYVRFPGGKELVELTYRVNRFRKDQNRVTVRQVAEVVVEAEKNQIMCPDFANLMDMSAAHKFVQDTI